LARTLASPYLGREPKVKVTTHGGFDYVCHFLSSQVVDECEIFTWEKWHT